MKGVELPINALVIVVIAVIVLLAVIAVYFTGWTPFAQSSEVESVKNAGCMMVVYDCSIDLTTILFDGSMAGLPTYDVTGEGTLDSADNMENLCSIHFGAGPIECAELCGCSI
jgi:hypothetical protein